MSCGSCVPLLAGSLATAPDCVGVSVPFSPFLDVDFNDSDVSVFNKAKSGT